jgi:hypothetical protein
VAVPDTLTPVCLWADPALPATAETSYVVQFFVADNASREVPGPKLSVAVEGNQPPCITGEAPAADEYVVDRKQPVLLEVTGVVDDRDSFGADNLSYAWSLWRERDQTWRDVPAHPWSSYLLDATGFGVGEKVRVRVEAIDRSGTRVDAASCDPSGDDCVLTSCALPSGQSCLKWRTWTLELR